MKIIFNIIYIVLFITLFYAVKAGFDPKTWSKFWTFMAGDYPMLWDKYFALYMSLNSPIILVMLALAVLGIVRVFTVKKHEHRLIS